MTSNNRISFIAIHRFLATFLIMLSALSGTAIAQNPVPLINQPLVPDAIAPGSAGFTLTVNGTGFASGSVVKWNGSPRATTFLSKSQLKAAVLSSDAGAGSMLASWTLTPRQINESYSGSHLFKQFLCTVSAFQQKRRVNSQKVRKLTDWSPVRGFKNNSGGRL